MEKKQNCIDWLFEEIKPCICRDEVCDLLYELRDELKSKHKDEIEDAYKCGYLDGESCDFNEYYNKTF
jgi:hypothetical protein